MFAPVHARSNASSDSVVGSPIFSFAQSACVRNAVAAMNSSGRIAEMQKRLIAITSGQEWRLLRRRPRGAGAGCGTATVSSAAIVSAPRG